MTIPTPEDCARLLLESVPAAMRTVRNEFRAHRPSDLSVPQFRALIFLNRAPGAALNELAEHLGLTAPTTSALAEDLVRRGLVERQQSSSDRRRITLTLTPAGSEAYEASYRAALEIFTQRLQNLSEAERVTMFNGLRTLRRLFSPAGQYEGSEKR